MSFRDAARRSARQTTVLDNKVPTMLLWKTRRPSTDQRNLGVMQRSTSLSPRQIHRADQLRCKSPSLPILPATVNMRTSLDPSPIAHFSAGHHILTSRLGGDRNIGVRLPIGVGGRRCRVSAQNGIGLPRFYRVPPSRFS